MNRTRRIAAGSVAGLAAIAGLFAVPTASAAPEPVPTAVTASEWACIAIGEIDVGACLDNPVPDTSGLPTVPEILADVLALLG